MSAALSVVLTAWLGLVGPVSASNDEGNDHRTGLGSASTSPIHEAGEDGAHADHVDVNRDVVLSVRELKAQSNVDRRALAMMALLECLSNLGASQLDEVGPSSVQEIASLLEVDGDVGRFYASKMLAILACRSRPVLPLLHEALDKTEPIEANLGPMVLSPAVSPREEVARAIREIEAAQPCE
ncbi:hypothetical protein E5C33_20055 [Stenotrophomonas maltophilia]|uniref:hypothetical protein n=1 Tax=Stenotrophomonas maltophilia TaxID=40324 RepID=UPI001076B864|nr:hypothetical protein [Stenotrophomonas maltophilia]TFZ42359.1 hypothetical protein E5C33_20055 [Stenotrophomonas maltophilia]